MAKVCRFYQLGFCGLIVCRWSHDLMLFVFFEKQDNKEGEREGGEREREREREREEREMGERDWGERKRAGEREGGERGSMWKKGRRERRGEREGACEREERESVRVCVCKREGQKKNVFHYKWAKQICRGEKVRSKIINMLHKVGHFILLSNIQI